MEDLNESCPDISNQNVSKPIASNVKSRSRTQYGNFSEGGSTAKKSSKSKEMNKKVKITKNLMMM